MDPFTTEKWLPSLEFWELMSAKMTKIEKIEVRWALWEKFSHRFIFIRMHKNNLSIKHTKNEHNSRSLLFSFFKRSIFKNFRPKNGCFQSKLFCLDVYLVISNPKNVIFLWFGNIFSFVRFIGNVKPLKITENRFFESVTDKTVASKWKTVCTHIRLI